MEMPKAPRFVKLLGPSFILLGLGLGSGELILWPYLTSNFGMDIIWAAVLGVTFQFIINMEIERYALSCGESIFVGYHKLSKILPFWFIFSTLLAWIWPGIIGTSARLFGEVFGINNFGLLGIFLLILIGIILTLGPVLYKTVEKLALILILTGIPLIIFLTFYMAKITDYNALLIGLTGFTKQFPESLPIASFLAAFAFAGAGGNLNLAQSFYIKEKGYGMGKFGGRITSILTGKVEEIKLEGEHFKLTDINLKRFKDWWKLVNLEHLLVFWCGSVVSILLLSLLAYSTVFGKVTPQGGVDFMIFESIEIAKQTLPFFGTLFLIIGGVMLFNTQLTVLDATSRIMAENLLLVKRNSWSTRNLPKIYYFFLWLQIISGIAIFILNFGQPLALITTSAVLNAVSMFVHIGLTLWLNNRELKEKIRPNIFRLVLMICAFIFFGYFSFKVIADIF
jgi:hypothetical protein